MLNRNLAVFILFLLICLSLSFVVRYNQFQVWKETPAKYFVNETPMMTTLDSYFWLHAASELSERDARKTEQRLRFFPDGDGLAAKIPLISYLIAKTSIVFGGNLYRTGFFLTMLLSALFIVPLSVYCYCIGFPAVGILGGVIGTFSYEYFIRTSIGRVDTDALMLFFLFLISLFVLKASICITRQLLVVYAILGGLTAYLFSLWWGKSGYTFLFSCVLFASVYLNQRVEPIDPKKDIHGALNRRLKSFLNRSKVSLSASILFFGSAFMFELPSVFKEGFLESNVTHFAEQYVKPNDTAKISPNAVPSNLPITAVAFPNVLQTVRENKRFSIVDSLSNLLGSVILSASGLFLFIVFFCRRWRVLIPLVPIFATGVLMFQGAHRLGMFLAPFIGLGYGFMLAKISGWLIRGLQYNRSGNRYQFGHRLYSNRFTWARELRNQVRVALPYLLSTIFFISIMGKTAIGYVPVPSIPVPNFLALEYLKLKLPSDSVVYTWWDYGHALTKITNRATFHDGGSQHTPKTYFIAKSLVSSDPQELHNVIGYLSSEGVAGIYRMIGQNIPRKTLFENVLSKAATNNNHSIYLMFTEDLIEKFKVIYSIGHWDFERKRFGVEKGYEPLTCKPPDRGILWCVELVVDLIEGQTSTGTRLREALIVDGGKISERLQFNNKDGKYLQVLKDGEQFLTAHMVDREVFESNFNQMYILGRYDVKLFTEYYNLFPWNRVFEVRNSGK